MQNGFRKYIKYNSFMFKEWKKDFFVVVLTPLPLSPSPQLLMDEE